MKFVLSSWGSRGEVEPCAAVGRELLRRGHEVCMAVPPDMVDYAATAVPDTVGFGSELNLITDAYREFWSGFFRHPWQIRSMSRMLDELLQPFNDCWGEMSATLTKLADGADLLLTCNVSFEMLAANVAEYQRIPLSTLHWFPVRPNGRLVPNLPAPVGRSAMAVYDWLSRGGWARKAEQAQRRELGLPKAGGSWPRRTLDRGPLEIQAYDELCFPGLADEWSRWAGQRPFVGALSLELATDDDADVAEWIAEGTPPIFFGFSSLPVKSPTETLDMIASTCAQLGERALVCAAASDFGDTSAYDHVKVAGNLNYGSVFPKCRAVVHHGGAGTTAAGLRAGVPSFVLWTGPDQMVCGNWVKRLEVGAARRLSTTTEQSLASGLREVLRPQYSIRAAELATRITPTAVSVGTAADLVERAARSKVPFDRRGRGHRTRSEEQGKTMVNLLKPAQSLYVRAAVQRLLGRPRSAAELCRSVIEAQDFSMTHYRAHTMLAELEFPGESYFEILARIHELLKPAVYLEVGIDQGRSFEIVRPETLALGIDPNPRPQKPLGPRQRVYAQTSDDFFDGDVASELGGKPIDLAFIDGMHHVEFALRDFINIERFCTPNSVILIHDVYPIDTVSAARDRTSQFWTGDIWRLILMLKKYRPDLTVNVIATRPSGLGVVQNLDPNSRILADHQDEILAEFLALDDSILVDKDEMLNRFPNEWASIERLLSTAAEIKG